MEFSLNECLEFAERDDVYFINQISKDILDQYFDSLIDCAISNYSGNIFTELLKIYQFIPPHSSSKSLASIVYACLGNKLCDFTKFIIQNIPFNLEFVTNIILWSIWHKIENTDLIYYILESFSLDKSDMEHIGMKLLSCDSYVSDDVIEIFMGNNYYLDKSFIKKYGIPSNKIDNIVRLINHGLFDYADQILDELITMYADENIISYLIDHYGNQITMHRSLVKYMDIMIDCREDLPGFADQIQFLKSKGFNFYVDPNETTRESIKQYICLINLFR